jgi:hypothetical protein
MAPTSAPARTRISFPRRFPAATGAVASGSNSNSENGSSSTQSNSLLISNFRFSNSERVGGRRSNLESLGPRSLGAPNAVFRVGVVNLPDTAERVETRVSHRKQTVAHTSTRDTSRPRSFLLSFSVDSNRRGDSAVTRRTGKRSSIPAGHQSPVTNHCLEAARNRVLASRLSALLLLQTGARGHRAQGRGAAP